MLEGATGVRGPTRLNFMAYWREANGNPTLGSRSRIARG
jgi:hypothetical protein